jgi:ATP-dependent helicase/nuclease subunit B
MKLSDFGQNITVIAPNQRLSAYLRNQYNQEQQASKTAAVWPSLDCLPLASWVNRAYMQITDAPLLLSEAQALVIWEKIITQSVTELGHGSLLFSSHQLADTAYQAWGLLQQWQVPWPLLTAVESEESQAFLHWAKKFAAYCQDHQCIDNSRAIEFLLKQFPWHRISSHKLVMAGFDELSPQVQQLISYLRQHMELHFYYPAIPSSHRTCVSFPTLDQELQAMAQWSYQQFVNNPQIRLACVIPDLSTIRDKVQRVFMEIFAPPTAWLNSLKTSVPFNISGGEAFSSFPLVRTALQILSLHQTQIPFETLSALLRSPFIAGAETEKNLRAQCDVLLRQHATEPVTSSAVLNFIQNKGLCPLWLSYWREFAKTLEQKLLQPPSAWAKHFAQQLHCVGWPGEHTLNSDEYQQFERWHTLLEELASLDLIDEAISYERAYHYLNNLADNTVFQARTDEVAIQILGILEAAGMHFDQLWIMGMNDHLWPQPPAPNPFIPVHLQRQFNMPHASAHRELEFSSRLTQHFCQSAKQVTFSYHQLEGDLPLTISPLLLDMDIPHEECWDYSAEEIISAQFEYLSDEWGPPVPVGKVPGGANIFKEQAACPFRAFAKTRLGATKLPPTTSGLTPQLRGALLHEILDQIWKKLGDHPTLLKQLPAELEMVIAETINSILQKYAAITLNALKPQFIAVEARRLQQLVKEWLEVEKQRPAFQVLSRELVAEIQVAQLIFKLRIDRIDQLADGSCIIIDYKTGLPRIEDWFGERPDEPQLPLYCLIESQHNPFSLLGERGYINALLFAQIRTEESCFKGIAAEDIGVAGVKIISQQTIEGSIKSWDEFKQRQRETLTKIAEQFQQGFARVDPKQPEKTCVQCDLHMLCRVRS